MLEGGHIRPKRKVENLGINSAVHCWRECRLGQPLWKTVWSYLKKLKMELPYNPAIPFADIYLKKHWFKRMHAPLYSYTYAHTFSFQLSFQFLLTKKSRGWPASGFDSDSCGVSFSLHPYSTLRNSLSFLFYATLFYSPLNTLTLVFQWLGSRDWLHVNWYHFLFLDM